MVINNILGIDIRSLALFRQIIALIYIFLVFVVRVLYFDYHSIENGPFTNEVFKSIQNAPILTSIIQTDVHLKIYLCLALIPGISLFLGVYPSISSFLAMFFYILLARRFFPYYYGTDELLVSILFVMGFVYLNPINSKNTYVSVKDNPFLLLLLVQISLVYWFNGMNKTDISWWRGEAVSMALFNVQFNKPLGLYFIKFDLLNKILTYFTLLFELTFPIWMFSPIKSQLFRIITAVFILSFHWGISLFADVTLYKFTGIAFFFLLMPSAFWDKFKILEKILINPKLKLNFNFNFNFKKIAAFLIMLIFLKGVNASIFKQNERYKFIKNERVISIMQFFKSNSYNPLRQYWFMFAPSPPKESGYIAFDYKNSNGKVENINIYGNDMPTKDFPFFHPFHLAMVIQYNAIAKGIVSKESEFVLFNLFKFEVVKDLQINKNRKQEDYELVLYQQTYENYMSTKIYNFNRIIIASYE